MLVITSMHNDQRLAKRGGIASIKSRIPLFVFFTKAHNDNIGTANRCTGADRIQLGAFMIMPKFIRFSAHGR